jgi:hypothetical protein
LRHLKKEKKYHTQEFNPSWSEPILIPIEKLLTDNCHSLCGINGYINQSKQSQKIRTITHKDFGDEEETF